jgi:glycosyltransferase involved in cell wall biosynthesis
VRIAIISSHPIQYHAPLFRKLALHLDLQVFFAHQATPVEQAKAGFGVDFDWDVDLLSGYAHEFVPNVARRPGLDLFSGCDTPEIGARLQGGSFSAVLVQGWHLKTYLQAIAGAKRLGIPVLARGDSQLLTPRSPLKRAAKSIVFPGFLRLFNAALYVGERSRVYWTHYGYPQSRLFFSPHSVDTEWFGLRSTTDARKGLRARLGIPPEKKIALFAGKLVPFKRPLDVIAAAAWIGRQGHDLGVLVAGAGPLETAMTTTAKAAGVTLYMLGFCNQTEMPGVYAAADVLILPSDGRETWGLVANEALACGLPIILSDAIGSAPDLAADGLAGRVFPVGDVVALAEAIGQLLDNRPRPEAIAGKSAAYSLERAADGILQAAESVADLRARSDAKAAYLRET